MHPKGVDAHVRRPKLAKGSAAAHGNPAREPKLGFAPGIARAGQARLQAAIKRASRTSN